MVHFQPDPSPQRCWAGCAAGLSKEGRSKVLIIGPLSPSVYQEKFLADLISSIPSAQLLEDAPNGASLNFWIHLLFQV